MSKPLTSPNVIVERGNIRPTAPHCYLPHCKNAVPCPDHIPPNNGTQDPKKVAAIEADLKAKREAKRLAELPQVAQVVARDSGMPCVWTQCQDRAVTGVTIHIPMASSFSEHFLCSTHAALVKARSYPADTDVIERSL